MRPVVTVDKDTIRQRVLETSGEFHYKSLVDGGKLSASSYGNLRRIMHALCEENVLSRTSKRDGIYRLKDEATTPIEWWRAPSEVADDGLVLPFGLHSFFGTSAGEVVIIAGEPNSGKTALLLNILIANLDRFPESVLLMSEGVSDLNRRLTSMTGENGQPAVEIPPKFRTYRKLTNFEDNILPDGLSIVDYLRPPSTDISSLMGIGDSLLRIRERLSTGIAVVGLQKPAGKDREFGYGGLVTAFEPTLYISVHNYERDGLPLRSQFESYLTFPKIKRPLVFGENLFKMRVEFSIERGINLHEKAKVYD